LGTLSETSEDIINMDVRNLWTKFN
jgi:hypothetical protein